jgi:hypothetical protein
LEHDHRFAAQQFRRLPAGPMHKASVKCPVKECRKSQRVPAQPLRVVA